MISLGIEWNPRSHCVKNLQMNHPRHGKTPQPGFYERLEQNKCGIFSHSSKSKNISPKLNLCSVAARNFGNTFSAPLMNWENSKACTPLKRDIKDLLAFKERLRLSFANDALSQS